MNDTFDPGISFALGTIDGVCVETTGGRHSHLREEAKSFAEQWLYERDTLDIAEAEIAAMMDSCELSRLEAIRTIACDMAGVAWLESLGWGTATADNMSFSPIPAKVSS